MAHNPLEQFQVKKIFDLHLAGFDVSFTNASLLMVIAVASIALFLGLGIRRRAMVPSRFQSMVELSYQFVADMVSENAGSEAMGYFPLIFSIFLFVIFCNLFGLFPYSFTVTSHIIVTFALAIFVFLGVTVIGFAKHGTHFFSYFVPKGLPGGIGGFLLAAFMVVIELFSYLARPISLSLRLAANMMAGHTILKITAGFVGVMGLLGVFPFAFLLIFTGFEIFVACLQAYIFALLSTIYLNDALHLH